MQLVSTRQALESYFRAQDPLLRSRKIKVEHLWTFFGHASKVFARSFMNELQIFDSTGCCPPRCEEKRLWVTCAALDWDGYTFSLYRYNFFINEFAGEKSISSLDDVPFEYFSNKRDGAVGIQLRDKLIQRGRKYCKICTYEMTMFQCQYQGPALVTPTSLQGLT
ncbi:hypothetical protein EJ02DRAFT_210517 [Clathrospora elynae]|uniref:DUF7025 domain-containing protein n=1 Tax=Clathrospora elynae TaxID=706981 RepID=A0A6A5SN79_9PLEO|nr:hypothetical protein EJ02DRAFT_210517 [Clathrospora elynae]